MKNIILIITTVFLSSCIGAGVNSKITANKEGYFPQITGIDLHGKKRELPQAFDKNLNLVVVAFKREQQANVDTWIKVADEIMAKNSEVGFFEVPLIYQLNPVSRSFVNNGMRRGVIEDKARQRTITVYTDREQFFKIMNMKEEKIYLLVLDKNGKIKKQITGDATKENIVTLKKFLSSKN